MVVIASYCKVHKTFEFFMIKRNTWSLSTPLLSRRLFYDFLSIMLTFNIYFISILQVFVLFMCVFCLFYLFVTESLFTLLSSIFQDNCFNCSRHLKNISKHVFKWPKYFVLIQYTANIAFQRRWTKYFSRSTHLDVILSRMNVRGR